MGGEFAGHQTIAQKLQAEFYLANPYRSWERGLNEYANRLIRQHIPEKSNSQHHDDKQITDVQHKINRRPREKLNFKTPKELFYKFVA